MALRSGTWEPRRLVTVALVLALHAGLFALLLRPILLQVDKPVESLVVVNIPAPPPPAVEAPEPAQAPAAAAPPAPRKKPRPVAAPTPPVPRPTEVAAAPATGTESASGAAASGPGTGSAGTGTGSGAGGTGAGGGSTKPRWTSGTIDRRDYPRDASRAGATGSVTVTLDITADGRVSGCTVARSSGTPSLDTATCRLIEQRFRFEPARDAAGNPVAGIAGWRQDWWLEPPRRLP